MQLHAGIIMDGNGRWAERRGLPRPVGHRAGAANLRRIIEAAPGLGIGTLTLYAFSSDNWQRPLPEVTALMQLFRRFLADETAQCIEHGVRLNVIGRRDRLGAPLLRAIIDAEEATAGGRELLLRIAFDYSGRDALRRAALRLARAGADDCSADQFGELVGLVDHARTAAPALDLPIRTGGEQRLSDFLLWETAYAELFFRAELWPDFRLGDLAEVMAGFRGRDRRFGVLGARRSALGRTGGDFSHPRGSLTAPRSTVTA
ncbi:MAG: di-trans,poly-cis-decaprenylcistransferase [Gemmatimonadetes bacterium]|nr:di-trans,poly-cis-decaprenylcistransferase [Gemmatimonadota bacterium]